MGIKWGYSGFRKLLTRNLKVKSLPYSTAAQSGAIKPKTACLAWPGLVVVVSYNISGVHTHIISSGADQNALHQEQILHDKRGRAGGAQWLRCYRLSRYKLVQCVDRIIIQRFLFPQSQFIIDWFHIVITAVLV